MIKPISESSNPIIPQETIKSVYNVKESNSNQYKNIIPQETIQSIYQNPSNLQNTQNNYVSTLSKMAPGGTITSVYKTNEEKNTITRKESEQLLSLIMPNETSVSVYQDSNKESNSINDPLLNLIPGETVKSVYKVDK